jgi:glycosyltransferase involved in cell wall biosynthesis
MRVLSAGNPKRTICMLTSGHSARSYRLLREAETLSAAGWAVSIAAPGAERSLDAYQRVHSLPIRSGIWGRWLRFVAMVRLPPTLRASILLAHELDSLLAAHILRLRWGARVVFDCHEFHPESIAEARSTRRPGRWLLETGITLVERLLAGSCAGVIAVNEVLAEKFRGMRRRTVTAPNYPRKRDYEGLRADDEWAALGEGRPVILYIGTLSRDRGILRLIDLMPRLVESQPDVLLVLLGRASAAAFLDALMDRIARLGMASHVLVRGPLPQEGVRAALAIADVGVSLLLPVNHRYEQSEPMKVFEYAAAGVPVVASALAAQARLVATMGGGLIVDPFDEQEVVGALAALLGDAALRREMGDSARSAFRSRYNWEQVEPQLLGFFEAVAAEDRP